MISSPLSFENFDTDAPFEPLETAEFLRGVEEGLTRAKASAAAQQTAALSEIAAVLADMGFGFAEARQQLAAVLHPLILQVADTILPEIARETFAAHLADTVEQTFTNAASNPVSIRVAPTFADMLNEAMSDNQTATFVFAEDPALAPGQAVLQNDEIYEMLDLPALTTALQTALHGLVTPERNPSYG